MSATVSIGDRGYANPAVLVSTEWVAEHLQDPEVRIVESNEDPLVYPSGHIPGAVEIDWTRDLNDPLQRDYIESSGFAALMSRMGITADTTVVLYGDKNNWWAAYAFWVFQLFGHTKAKLMDGGRLRWEQEGRPLSREKPVIAASDYPEMPRDDAPIRAFREQVLEHVRSGKALVDVRSLEEYSGQRLHMPDYPNEGALRGGHIPGARNVPWARAVNEDGTFKSADDLRAIYVEEQGLDPEQEVVAYCRIGERSSHTWFVLSYLLGFEKVRNYDGSWTEWGNLVGVPVER
jgi:thiosulfate/3-mercaptopyruvate sulfurtransferase